MAAHFLASAACVLVITDGVMRPPAALLRTHMPAMAALEKDAVLSSQEGARAPSVVFGQQPPALTLLSPAKVNMFLRILRRRDDGYHELASLFQTVSLFDTLDFWLRAEEEPCEPDVPLCSMEVAEGSLCADLIPTDESNLVMRAMLLFAERTGSTQRLHCRLLKRIPAQAGLGGGSSDAATALHAANRLAGFPASEDELIRWGGELGSDVSFFLSRGTAYCTGRGELVEPVAPLQPARCWLIKPQIGLSTPQVFGALGLSAGEELPGADPQELLDQFSDSVDDAPYINDLEPPAFSLVPLLAELHADLGRLGFTAVMMSGSGTTFFCIGEPSPAAADTWQAELSGKYGVDIFGEAFCFRGDDPALWYAEQPTVPAAAAGGGAEPEGAAEGAAEAAEVRGAPPDGFEWGGIF